MARPWLAVLAGLLILPGVARAQQQPTPEAPGTTLQKVGFDQNLDAQVPLDLPFRDEQGRPVRLGDYFGRRPVILTLVYYRCPMLCGLELNGLARSLKPLTPAIGRDFEVVTVSIDPTETPELAAEKKANYMKRYGRDGTEGGWHFLTGEAGSIARLAQAVGFRYTYNPQTKLYAHAAGLVILTPGGRIARYFYGIDFPAKDVQGALAEAQAGKVGAPIARLLLFCYDYDPTTGKYTLAIMRTVRVLGSATALALGTFTLVMFRRDFRTRRLAPVPGTED